MLYVRTCLIKVLKNEKVIKYCKCRFRVRRNYILLKLTLFRKYNNEDMMVNEETLDLEDMI